MDNFLGIKFYSLENIIFLFSIPFLIIFFLLVRYYFNRPLYALKKSPVLEKLTLKSSNLVRRIRFIALLTFLVTLNIALLDPRWGEEKSKVEKKGIDIVFMLDVSKSMLAEDISPNRLENSKLQIANFLNILQQDRVGLMVFSGESIVLCPLTSDYNALEEFIQSIDTDITGLQGTELTTALEMGISMFDNKLKNHKSIILMTDGENHQKDAEAMLEKLENNGITLFSVGIGSEKGELIPVKDSKGQVVDYLKDNYGKVVYSRLNEKDIKYLAIESGGKFYNALLQRNFLNDIYLSLQQIDKKKMNEQNLIFHNPKFYYFVWMMFISLLVATFLIYRRRVGDSSNLKQTTSKF